MLAIHSPTADERLSNNAAPASTSQRELNKVPTSETRRKISIKKGPGHMRRQCTYRQVHERAPNFTIDMKRWVSHKPTGGASPKLCKMVSVQVHFHVAHAAIPTEYRMNMSKFAEATFETCIQVCR